MSNKPTVFFMRLNENSLRDKRQLLSSQGLTTWKTLQQFHLFWDGLVILSRMRGLPWLGRESVWVPFCKMSVFPEVRSAVIASSSPQWWKKDFLPRNMGTVGHTASKIGEKRPQPPRAFHSGTEWTSSACGGSLSGRKRIRWPLVPVKDVTASF